MAFKTYNNNSDNRPTVSVYPPNLNFAHGDSKIMESRLSFTYFNHMLKVSIALRNNSGGNDSYATFDAQNAISIYMSPSKANVLAMGIEHQLMTGKANNVCVELKNGLLKFSNGAEYGTSAPCVSITYAREDGSVNEVVYETKTNYTCAKNYDAKSKSFESVEFDNFELNYFLMILKEYYKSSSYAIAASVMEASMYKREHVMQLLNSIGDKLGVRGNNGTYGRTGGSFLNGNNPPAGGSYGTSSFGNAGGMNNNNRGNMIPKEYEVSSFDDMMASM